MKSSAIIRIIIYTLIICVLLAVLSVGIQIRSVGLFSTSLLELFSRDESLSEGVIGSSGSVNASEIDEIEIEWVSGSVSICSNQTNQISFSENEVKEDYKMVWEKSGNKLTIKFCNTQKWNFGITSNVSKNLTVTLPATWSGKEVVISSVSADINVSGLNADKIKLENVSGVCDFQNCSSEKVTLNTVSGNLRYSGTLQALSCDSVSAECRAELNNCPDEIDMEAVSGNLTLVLPEDCGFTAKLDTASGSCHSSFETTVSEHDGHSGKYVYGDGSCQIHMEGVSGHVYIEKHSSAK